MATVPIALAATQLPELFARAEAGEEVVIAHGEYAGIKLVPIKTRPGSTSPRRKTFGMLRGKITVPPSFWGPLPPGYDGWPDDEPA